MRKSGNHLNILRIALTCWRVWHNCVELPAVGLAQQVFLGESVRLQQLFNTAQARLWMRFMLLGLVAFVCLGRASEARASCGYYVIIGHPSADAAAEQARMRHEQLPLE